MTRVSVFSGVNTNSGYTCSLSINLEPADISTGVQICQFAMNNSSTLRTGTDATTSHANVNQTFIFGPYSDTPMSINCNGTNGPATAPSTISASTFHTYSDYRLKKNIEGMDETFTVDNIRPVEYDLGPDSCSNKKYFGVIAHELAEIYPNLVDGEKDAEKMQTVNYLGLIPILIQEIMTLKKKNRHLKMKIDNILKTRHELETRGEDVLV